MQPRNSTSRPDPGPGTWIALACATLLEIVPWSALAATAETSDIPSENGSSLPTGWLWPSIACATAALALALRTARRRRIIWWPALIAFASVLAIILDGTYA